MTTTISNADDLIDSRDVIERIEKLRHSILDQITNGLGKVDDDDFEAADLWAMNNYDDANNPPSDLIEFYDSEELEELKTLLELAEEAEPYAGDWQYGATLIRDSYFKEYAQELAEDIGAIDSEARWPCRCIDWDKAADELKQDYTSVEFDGETYWTR